jgi:hypothetical protein
MNPTFQDAPLTYLIDLVGFDPPRSWSNCNELRSPAANAGDS